MKKFFLNLIKTALFLFITTAGTNFLHGQDQNTLTMNERVQVLGNTKPIPVSLEGFSGEVLSVLKFDLYVQGFSFVSPDAAQYQISGSNSGNVIGHVADKFAKREILSRNYTGASLRRQAHAFTDDIVQTITGKKGISQTKIAFKASSPGGNGEIYVADFDGYNHQAVTHDNTIVASPTWVPGHLAICYNSYLRNNPDIFYHDFSDGQRRSIAHYSGSNISPSVSPDGSKVAFIASKSGSPDVWVCNIDGSNLKQLTKTPEDE